MSTMPITDFLSCTEPLDEFESLSPHQTHHAKTYVTGLIAANNKTVEGIAREVQPAQGKRALNKFLTQYNWDKDQLNHERLEDLQAHGETRWSKDGFIIIDDSVDEKTGEYLPGVGTFYDHAEGETVWGQNLVYAFYADEKTAYPLAFRLYEDDDDRTKYDLAREIITELEEAIGVPAQNYLMDAWFTHDSTLVEHIESYGKAWIGPLRSNRNVTYGGEEIRVDELEERIDKTEREIDGETYKIWTQKRPVSKLGEVRLLIAEKVTDDEDEANPVKYFASNKIDAPSAHLIRSYSYRWPVEVFFEDSKQDLGLGDCEVRDAEGARRHWHLHMLAYSLLRLGPASNASGTDPESAASGTDPESDASGSAPESDDAGTLQSKASSIQVQLEYALKEILYSLFSWVRDHPKEGLDDLMEEIDHLFIHSDGSTGSKGWYV